eukprot:7334417-Alexandrium_andersonii.AAC.1
MPRPSAPGGFWQRASSPLPPQALQQRPWVPSQEPRLGVFWRGGGEASRRPLQRCTGSSSRGLPRT